MAAARTHRATVACSRRGTFVLTRDLSASRVNHDYIARPEYFESIAADDDGRLFIRSDTDPIRMVEHKADKPIESLSLDKVRIEQNPRNQSHSGHRFRAAARDRFQSSRAAFPGPSAWMMTATTARDPPAVSMTGPVICGPIPLPPFNTIVGCLF